MAEQSPDNEKTISTKRSKKRLWIIFIFFFALILGLLFWRFFLYESVDEQLAAIEAARAIPDSENVAIIYNRLLKDYGEFPYNPDILTPAVYNATFSSLWSSKDYPELWTWIEEQQDFTDKLLQTLKYQKCRYPVTDFLRKPNLQLQKLSQMRRWASFLVIAANNDIAEGRIDKALEKYFCIIRMGKHLQQQPVVIEFLVGITVESLALFRMQFCITNSDLNEEHLQAIESILPQTGYESSEQWKNMVEVEKLYMKKTPLLDTLKEWIRNWQNPSPVFDKVNEIATRLLANRRGTEILIALRRFKNKTGNWPESLDEIKPFVSKEILINPQSNKPFVYQPNEYGFVLYGTGRNKIYIHEQEVAQ
jgi:hypothetical protein